MSGISAIVITSMVAASKTKCLPLPSYFLQLLLGDAKVFPVYSGFAPGSPPSWRHPNHIPEPRHLALSNAMVHKFHSELLPNVCKAPD